MRGWRSAASRSSRGGPAPPRRSWKDAHPVRRSFAARRRRRFPRQRLPATTASRSNWRGGSWCAPWPWRRPARPIGLPPFLLLHSRLQERFMTLELTQNPAHARHGSNIGQPLTRREGRLKVTGQARYAADNHPPGMLHAVLAVSSIARGRVSFLDVAAAKAHPGVVEVMTPANRPPLKEDPDAKTNPFMFRLDLLQNDLVRYANQSIAVVIAETLEAATEGAALLAPRYEEEPARAGLDADESFVPPAVGIGNPAVVAHGDVEGALKGAAHTIDATYETPAQYHN